MALSELDALAKAVPGLNQKAAKQQQAAQRIQARAAVGQAAPGQTPAQVGQQVAPALMQAQQQAGQQAQAQTQATQLGAAQGMAQQQAFQGQQGLAKQGIQQAAQLAGKQRDLQVGQASAESKLQRRITDKEIEQAERLQRLGMEQDNKILQLDLNTRKQIQALGADLEDKIFDSRRRFDKSENQRKFTNARQLADFAVGSAQTEQDAMAKLQEIQQSAQMKAIIMQAAHDKIIQELSANTQRTTQSISADSKRKMAEEARKAKLAAQRAASDAAATGNIINGVVSGAAAGLAYGGPWGALAGGLAGGAAAYAGNELT